MVKKIEKLIKKYKSEVLGCQQALNHPSSSDEAKSTYKIKEQDYIKFIKELEFLLQKN